VPRFEVFSAPVPTARVAFPGRRELPRQVVRPSAARYLAGEDPTSIISARAAIFPTYPSRSGWLGSETPPGIAGLWASILPNERSAQNVLGALIARRSSDELDW
jgi:hypothetical protein